MTGYYTLQQIEEALDSGRLYWLARTQEMRVRRNGKTRHWKRDPDRWEVPIKVGFRSCGTISPAVANPLFYIIKED